MADYFVGKKEYFPSVGKIHYEGPESDNPLAFKYYDAERLVGGKTMKEHLRFAVAYWHSFCGDGLDRSPRFSFPRDISARRPAHV